MPHPPLELHDSAAAAAAAATMAQLDDASDYSVRSLLAPQPDPRMAFGVATAATPADTAVARIGFDNDGFMSTSSDGWTWPSPNPYVTWGEPATSDRAPLGTCGSLTTPLGCSDHGAMAAPGQCA